MTESLDSPRHSNRRTELLEAAARLFAEKGYDSTSMRDIANAVGMLPGSLYYHFPSKEDLFVAIHEAGVEQIVSKVATALEGISDPWTRLEEAAAAHLEALFDDPSYAIVMTTEYPAKMGATVAKRLIEQRDRYEQVYRELIAELPLPAGVSPGLLRLSLFGSMNWAPRWYKPDGDTPADIGRSFVKLLRNDLEQK